MSRLNTSTGRRGTCATGSASAFLARHTLPGQALAKPVAPRTTAPRAFTLVEMLVAMAITLVMMAAVVTLFANVSGSVRNRRATIEMSSQLRHVRNVLQQDLQGATCPGLTWQRPESNHGYIELIEGQYREGNASNLIDADPNASPPKNWPPTALNPEIDHATSILPSSNLPFADPTWATDGAGLGDYDDILMLTVRNEHEPFVGRIPTGLDDNESNDGDPAGFAGWESETIESPLAEVIWFAIENPGYTDPLLTDPTANGFFGEPGMRTIYRRTLLIAPWVNPYLHSPDTENGVFPQDGGRFKAVPGLVRLMPSTIAETDVATALACLIAFQDRYDLSVRVEWDYNIQRWKIVANTLADLTKRENRCGHFGFRFDTSSGTGSSRIYPYPMASFGSGYSGNSTPVAFVIDPEFSGPTSPAQVEANMQNAPPLNGLVVSYRVVSNGLGYDVRPLAYIDDTPDGVPATANAMLNDDGQVVRVIHGPVPLWGTRRGEDVMMTDTLAFDVRVYDPGAPLFRHVSTDTVLTPSDPAWRGIPTNPPTIGAYPHADNMGSSTGIGTVTNNNATFPYVGQGAYVDLGYGYDARFPTPALPLPYYHPNFASSAPAWFFEARGLSDVFGRLLAPGYSVYDTWSFHYENDGVNEDADTNAAGQPLIDEGTNGLDDVGQYANPTPPPLTVNDIRLGIDDVGERETVPPYDKPLRGLQVLMRAYERDSRAIRQVRINQHFMPE